MKGRYYKNTGKSTLPNKFQVKKFNDISTHKINVLKVTSENAFSSI